MNLTRTDDDAKENESETASPDEGHRTTLPPALLHDPVALKVYHMARYHLGYKLASVLAAMVALRQVTFDLRSPLLFHRKLPRHVRQKDVCDLTGWSKADVNRAFDKLRDWPLPFHDGTGFLDENNTLYSDWKKRMEGLGEYQRHGFLPVETQALRDFGAKGAVALKQLAHIGNLSKPVRCGAGVYEISASLFGSLVGGVSARSMRRWLDVDARVYYDVSLVRGQTPVISPWPDRATRDQAHPRVREKIARAEARVARRRQRLGNLEPFVAVLALDNDVREVREALRGLSQNLS